MGYVKPAYPYVLTVNAELIVSDIAQPGPGQVLDDHFRLIAHFESKHEILIRNVIIHDGVMDHNPQIGFRA